MNINEKNSNNIQLNQEDSKKNDLNNNNKNNNEIIEKNI